MDDKKLDRIATLLQIIVDELYLERTDRELEGVSGTSSGVWHTSGRNAMVRKIEQMREDAARAEET